MGDYCHLYVQTDTLLLVDVFEKFRDKCLKYLDLTLLIFTLHLD